MFIAPMKTILNVLYDGDHKETKIIPNQQLFFCMKYFPHKKGKILFPVRFGLSKH